MKMEYKPATNKYSDFELLFLENSDTKIRIPAFIFKPKDFYQYNCIIIYCHGNSGDIGTSFMECQILSRNLRCEVLSFEYPGYGLSNDLNNRNDFVSYPTPGIPIDFEKVENKISEILDLIHRIIAG